jgi:hypothetical protein
VPIRGYRRAAVAAVAVVLAAVIGVILARDGGEPGPPRPSPTPTATPTATPTPEPRLDLPPRGPSLAVGITEPNPSLVATPGALAVPPGWGRRRDQLARMRPAVYRLVVNWAAVQPAPAAPPDLARPETGCMRAVPPCAPYAGVRDQLRALASRQREGGWTALVVFTSTPAWAAAPATGCREEAQFGAPRATALGAYRRLIADVIALARTEGAELRYFSPWNEPNHPYFLGPQRAACDPDAPSRATPAYAALADAMRAELDAQPGDQRLVLGETAGFVEPTSRATSVPEMIAGLPRGLVCGTRVWSQHAYIGGTEPVAAVTAALAARRCPRRHAIWITETGVGPAPGGLSLARGITSERQGCRLLHERLLGWYENPRVTVAVQYTFREDDRFPTGLVTTDLSRARPALGEWQAWGSRPRFDAPPPALGCRRS